MSKYVLIAGKIKPTGYDSESFEELIGEGLIIDGEKIRIDPATLNGKVDQEDGKGLSSNDFTDSYKDKLDNLDQIQGVMTPATNTKLGGIIVGAGLEITENGVLSVTGNDNGEIPGTISWQNVTDKPDFFDISNSNYLNYELLKNKLESEKGLEINNNRVGLTDEFYNYLDNATYAKPSVSFSISGFPSSIQEVGYSFTGSRIITYSVTNQVNMNGDFTMSGITSGGPNDTIVLSKSGTQSSASFTLITSSPSSKTITVSGKDVKNNTISATRSFSVLFPLFAGFGPEEITGSEVYQFINNSNGYFMTGSVTSIKGSYSTSQESKRYMWFCVPSDKSITKVTGNGFGTVLNSPISIDVSNQYGITTTYKCYRIYDKLFLDSVYDFVVTQ